jgi:hypothetical protein
MQPMTRFWHLCLESYALVIFVTSGSNKFPNFGLLSSKESVMNTVNIKEELIKNRSRRLAEAPDALIDQALNLIDDAYFRERQVVERIKGEKRSEQEFSWASLDPDRLYALDDIRSTCIQYRLRFLDSAKFKGEIPYEAVLEIRRLEKQVGAELSDFAIMAPDARFKLEDCDKDPVLFVKLSNNYYYYIHQWGNDMAWYRKMMVWPLRSFATLGASIAMVSLLLSFLVPTELLLGESAAQSGFARMALFFWFLVSITSIVTYVGFAFFKNVTANQWNSPFYKQEF